MAKNSKYDIHNDFNFNMAIMVTPLTIWLGAVLPGMTNWMMPGDKGLSCRKDKIKCSNGIIIPMEIAEPEGVSSPAPCILYFHGGAFIIGASARNKSIVYGLAKKVPCKVIAVDYRLAGKHPFPAGVEDCYAALEWVDQNAEKLGIDKQKIAVYGESAGGALAAAVAQMARDRKGPQICFQMLIYPVTDCSGTTESARIFTDTPVWRSDSNSKMWKAYLRNSEKPYSPYASPLCADSLAGLPPAYVETAEFDPLRDEGMLYANRIKAEKGDVTLVQTRRTVHGFDMFAKNEIVQESFRIRVEALKKYLLSQA